VSLGVLNRAAGAAGQRAAHCPNCGASLSTSFVANVSGSWSIQDPQKN
jgi:hypothetical protein